MTRAKNMAFIFNQKFDIQQHFKRLAVYMIYYLFILAFLLLGCGQTNPGTISEKKLSPSTDTIPATKTTFQNSSFFNNTYFSKEDAEKILGEKAFLKDSSKAIKKDTLEIKTAYAAGTIDQQTDNTGVIYFMIEEYSQDSSAKNAYDFIKAANEKHEGVTTVHNMGDQAYFHSDGTNFYFILVRKRKIMFRIKVNKITSHTSLNEFNLVSKRISDAL